MAATKPTSTSNPPPPLPPDLLAVLACPACEDRPGVTYDAQTSSLVCPRCARRYPIREGIVLMCIEDAQQG